MLIKTYDIWLKFFLILRLRLRPTAKGRSLSGPNIRLRTKVKIAPSVQHWFSGSSKTFVLAQKPKIIFLSGEKILWLPQYLNKFLVWRKKIWTSPKHFGTCKRTRHKINSSDTYSLTFSLSTLNESVQCKNFWGHASAQLPNDN